MGALGAAISGLQASQKWLDVISNNVSNSNTVGYKQGRLSFSSLISDGLRAASGPNGGSNIGGLNPTQVGLGVQVSTVQTIMKQGALQVTGNATDVAIQGNGFFTVAKGQETLYTRAGNLTFDFEGNLVTPDGGKVQGWSQSVTRGVSLPNPVVQITTTLDTTNPNAISDIKIPNNLVLAPMQTTSQASPAIKDEGVILKGNLDNNTPANAAPLTLGAAQAAGALTGYIPDAVTAFTVYDSLGTEWDFTMLWQQVNPTPGSQAAWEWTMWYTPAGSQPSDTALFVNPPAGPQAGAFVADSAAFQITAGGGNTSDTATNGPVTFNADGSLQSNGVAPGATGGTFNVQIGLDIVNGAIGAGGTASTLQFSINMGTPDDPNATPPEFGLRDGLTGDFGGGTFDAFGNYQPVQTIFTDFVDGYSQGTLLGLSIDQLGGVNASFSNNQTVTIAQLAMTKFQNQEGLESIGGNMFRTTVNSGQGQVGTAGQNGFGLTQGGALESSNVDLTIELTNMIIAQRMFESNARVVTSADRVLDTLVNLGR